MLKVENVSFSYIKNESVLNNISFQVNEGENIGLIGANGAGKSTLFKAILGLVNYDGVISLGEVVVDKKNLATIRKKIGIVLQDSDNQMFMPTVIDDMMFGPVNYGMDKSEARKKAIELLNDMGISHLGDRYNYRLSCGEKRMAAIATILMMNPELILMDEPSASLDPYNRRQLINTLNKLDTTKIIATHDLELVLETCDRVILLDKGEIVADGKSSSILRDKELLEKHRLELPYSLMGEVNE